MLVAQGRTHFYEGRGPGPVVALARIAAAAGARSAVLVNAGGCLRSRRIGEVMTITDLSFAEAPTDPDEIVHPAAAHTTIAAGIQAVLAAIVVGGRTWTVTSEPRSDQFTPMNM